MAKTMVWLKEWFGEKDKYVIMETVVALLPWLVENWEKIKKAQQKVLKPKFEFKFLEIFSEPELFKKCVRGFKK